MSIVKMQKVAVVGIDTCRSTLMSQLIDLESVQLTDQTGKLSDTLWASNVCQDEGQENITKYEMLMSKASQALDVIDKYGALKKPLFETRRIVKENVFKASVSDSSAAENAIEKILEINESIKSTQDAINKIDSDTLMLTPWVDFDLPLDELESTRTRTTVGIAPISTDINTLEATLKQISDSSYFKIVNQDNDYFYLAFITMKENTDSFLSEIKESGFTPLSFDSFTGTPSKIIAENAIFKESANKKLESLIASIADIADVKSVIEDYSDNISIDLEKEKARSKILKTQKTFFIEGWIPVSHKEKAIEVFEENNCLYKFRDPEEGEEVPVLLKNKSFFKPIEAITEMYSLPAYGSFDPTTIYALWYICFFGMMFSDACYGLIMVAFCLFALKKFNLEGTTYKMIKGFLYCGISTIFWGVMFGGYFGDFFEVFASTILGKTIDIKPLWFDPLSNPLKLLIFSLILGVIHIFIGMGISVYMKCRDGDVIGAIFGEGAWYIALIGCISWVAFAYFALPYAEISKWVTIIGAAMLFIGGGIGQKGFGKISGGLLNLYNITSYMSDILSYSRILALGLATSVIAQVVNMMGALAGGGIVGALVLLLVFFIGQVINFVINVLGSFVHASRLQYIEFFGKFYVDGGEAFEPFMKKTKYVKIEK